MSEDDMSEDNTLRLRRIGTLRLPPEFLVAALNLPPDTEVLGVSMDYTVHPALITLSIRNPLLRSVPKGEPVPAVNAQYTMRGWRSDFDKFIEL